ncbi:penicillin acylase family protein [Deinococcus yavapaiensis]|uniref:Penicillin amidase n=1 Tax=Deinococcus yavapaiensis KR-236 TaxID=694435 RepID=A0A318S403_9DEIO|nr:penicillin acylase family protein [Deinococcus yavapaiensis]PYE52790.1 penicillin amidase [Deinococcus yavapaiensis KR-236]
MRLLLRVLGSLLGLIVLAAVAAFLFVSFTAAPRTTGTVRVSGPSGPVTITRDVHGVPHIVATASDEDALFGLGFVHAQDRLWQMEFQRRVGAGRLSEVLGSAAVEQDKFLRTWGFYRAARQALPALSARTRRLLTAYTAGVNAGIAQGKRPLEFRLLRFEPETWTDVDSLVWSKLMAFDLGGNWEEELGGQDVAEKLGKDQVPLLYPAYPKDGPTILSAVDLQHGNSARVAPSTSSALLPATRAALRAQLDVAHGLGFRPDPDKGSNNWVISGRFTKSGKPLLADDPHLGLSAPMLWYLAELKGPTLHVIGATIPGLPGVVIGRTERVAWGVTNTGPDVQDLFVLPENAKVKSREEVIKVSGKPDVRLTVQESTFGPIITGVGGVTRQRVALRWPALDPGDTTLDAFLGLNYARDWQDFRTALRSFVAPMQNFVYADVSGNIGYIAPGKIPVRDGWDGRLPVTGDGSKRWTGYVAFDDLPYVYNPPEGLIVTANNKAVPDSYPYLLANDSMWAAPYRAQRILQLVKDKVGLTVTDMQAAQYDVQSLLWADFKDALLKTTPKDDVSKSALNALRSWNGRQTLDSVGSSVFAAWYSELSTMPMDELRQDGHWNSPAFLLTQLQKDGPYCRAAQTVTSCEDWLAVTLQRATAKLAKQLGPDVSGWRWERLHKTASNHRALGGVKAVNWIWNRSIASAGGLSTVNVGSYDLDTFSQTNAPSYRHVVDLADMNASRFVGTLGQSGNPLDARYDDQQALWRDGKYLPMSTNEQDWGRTQVLTLRPK